MKVLLVLSVPGGTRSIPRLGDPGFISHNKNIYRSILLWFLAAALAGSFACRQTTPVPPLPKVITSGFPARVRTQVDTALRDASAHPEAAAACGRLGMLLHTYSQLDLAEICYRRAHLLDPKAFEWAYYLAVVEQTHGETKQAIADARAAVRLDRASRPARMRLAESLLQAKEFKESRRLYEKLVAEEPDLAVYHYGLGKALAAQGSVDPGLMRDAIEQYRRACELSPVFSAARYALAMAYRQTKDIEQASRELVIYQRNPSGSPPEDPMMAQITALNQGGLIRAQAAQQYLAQGRPDEAAKQLETAVANDPNDETAHSNLVAVYWELQQWDKAEEHYRIAVKLNPATSSHYVFGLVMLDKKRYPEAAEAFRRALVLNPRDNGANTQLGRVFELQGDLKGAIRQYEVALESDPNSRATNYVLGMALLKQGQGQAAIEHLLKTLQPVDEKTQGYTRELAAAYRKVGDENRARYFYQVAGGGSQQAGAGSLTGQKDVSLQTGTSASGQ
jgi:tetratricopeptide (TPR) repeat protein